MRSGTRAPQGEAATTSVAKQMRTPIYAKRNNNPIILGKILDGVSTKRCVQAEQPLAPALAAELECAECLVSPTCSVSSAEQ